MQRFHGVGLNEVRSWRPEQYGFVPEHMLPLLGGLNEVRSWRPEQWNKSWHTILTDTSLNEVRSWRPEQSGTS